MFVATDVLANRTVAFEKDTFVCTRPQGNYSAEYLVLAYWYTVKKGQPFAAYGIINIQIDVLRIPGRPRDLTFEQMLQLASHESDGATGYIYFGAAHKLGGPKPVNYADWFERNSMPSNYDAATLQRLLDEPMVLPPGTDGWYRLRSGWQRP